MLTSATLSVMGALDDALGQAKWLLVIAACLTEPLKLLLNQVIWNAPGARFRHRAAAWVGYTFCICVSVALMHLLAERQVAELTAQDRAQEAAGAAQDTERERVWRERRASLKALEDDLEGALRGIVPGLKEPAHYREELKKQLSTRERRQVETELAAAVNNAQLKLAEQRLRAKIIEAKDLFEISEAERSRTLAERSPNDNVRNVRNVRDVRNVRKHLPYYALAFGFFLEVAISLGIWGDAVRYRAVTTPQAPEPPSGHRSAPNERTNDRIPASATVFHEAMQKEWRSNRAKDGWLEGTQQGWAQQLGVSSGFVYRQLDRMVAAGLIEKRTSAKKTWIRFIETRQLKLVVKS